MALGTLQVADPKLLALWIEESPKLLPINGVLQPIQPGDIRPGEILNEYKASRQMADVVRRHGVNGYDSTVREGVQGIYQQAIVYLRDHISNGTVTLRQLESAIVLRLAEWQPAPGAVKQEIERSRQRRQRMQIERQRVGWNDRMTRRTGWASDGAGFQTLNFTYIGYCEIPESFSQSDLDTYHSYYEDTTEGLKAAEAEVRRTTGVYWFRNISIGGLSSPSDYEDGIELEEGQTLDDVFRLDSVYEITFTINRTPNVADILMLWKAAEVFGLQKDANFKAWIRAVIRFYKIRMQRRFWPKYECPAELTIEV